MRAYFVLCSLFAMTLFSFVSQAQESIQLAMPDYPPYTTVVNGKASGFGYDLTQKIMDKAGLKLTVVPVPNYGRALADTKEGKVDGFFLASQNPERDEVAVFSSPITVSVWTWVALKDAKIPDFKSAEFKSTATVGVQLNSNIHKWLKNNGYKDYGVPDISVLVKMLTSKRVSAILLPDLTIKDILQKEGDKLENYQTQVEAEFPFGFYISKAFLSKKPELMKSINDAIKEVKGN